MKKFIFTFTLNHPLRDFYQPIFAKDSETARAKMCEIYGKNWGFQYTEEQWKRWEEEAVRIGVPLQSSLTSIYCGEEIIHED